MPRHPCCGNQRVLQPVKATSRTACGPRTAESQVLNVHSVIDPLRGGRAASGPPLGPLTPRSPVARLAGGPHAGARGMVGSRSSAVAGVAPQEAGEGGGGGGSVRRRRRARHKPAVARRERAASTGLPATQPPRLCGASAGAAATAPPLPLPPLPVTPSPAAQKPGGPPLHPTRTRQGDACADLHPLRLPPRLPLLPPRFRH